MTMPRPFASVMWLSALRCSSESAKPRAAARANVALRQRSPTACWSRSAIAEVARSSRCSVFSIAREVNRCSPRPSLPNATSSGAAFTAAITRLNCSLPSLCRCTNIARSRVVKVA